MQKIKSFFEKTISLNGKLFIWWRFLFGVYFMYYSIRMIPYVEELYGESGIVSDISLNWTYGLFPNIFSVFPGAGTAFILYVGIIIFAGLLAFGYVPRISALGIWYAQTALYNRDILTSEPSLAFVGLLLVTLALVPNQPKLSLKKTKEKVVVPYFVFFLPVIIFCLTFTVSALDKTISSSWISGTALIHMLDMGIMKDNFIAHFFYAHSEVTSIASYLAMFVQLVCLPLLILGLYRVALLLNMAAFICIFYLIDINQVIYGMLFFYSFFLLDVDFSKNAKQYLFS